MPRLDSSAIRRVTYNPKTQKMNVQFVGTGKQYTFVGVPEDVYDDFINSSSAGQFFNDNIKNDYIAEPSEFVSSVRFDRPGEDEFYESTDLMKLGLSVLKEQRKPDLFDILGGGEPPRTNVTKDVTSSAILRDTDAPLFPFTTVGQDGLPYPTPGENPKMNAVRALASRENLVQVGDDEYIHGGALGDRFPTPKMRSDYVKPVEGGPGMLNPKYTGREVPNIQPDVIFGKRPRVQYNPGGEGAILREPYDVKPKTTDPVKFTQQFNKANPKNPFMVRGRQR
jgi:hypothetical protein